MTLTLHGGTVIDGTGTDPQTTDVVVISEHHHHNPGVPGLTQGSLVCDGPDEVRVAARTAFRRGATQIKICVSGGVVSLTDSLEDTQFTVEELRAAVLEAQARDTYVTA